MSAIYLVLIAAAIFLIAYVTYGSWLAKKWGFDPSRQTPAHEMNDGVDYCPAKAPVLLGHHFSSIAGAGPIVGPIAAAMFGWLPVFLWVIIGSVFFGGVHDMGSLFLSVRNKGRSLGESIGHTLGKTGKILFAIFAWLTLILVVAAFANIVANTFGVKPALVESGAADVTDGGGAAATASLLFIALAVGFGIAVYRKGVSLALGTIVGVVGMVLSIWLGTMFPLALSNSFWMYFLLVYIFIASVTPVWILLQPRDYLNSFLLYAMLIGGMVGIFIYNPQIVAPQFTEFVVGEGAKAQWLFPMLFVTVACGAISGFHALVGSGTTSKQLDSEKDLKLVGYGSMLIEGLLAVVSVITVAYLAVGEAKGTPIAIFSGGLGNFMTSFGLPLEIGKTFVTLAISAFALTSLDTATRLARFIFQEAFTGADGKARGGAIGEFLANRYVATFVTVALSGWLGFSGYSVIWPIFGSANQLLAAIALIAIAVALRKEGKSFGMIVIPMIFMFVVTITALGFLINGNIIAIQAASAAGKSAVGTVVLMAFAIALMVLAFILAALAIKSFMTKNPLEKARPNK